MYIDAWRDTWYLEFEENLKDVVHGQHFAVIPKGHIPVQRQLSCHVCAQGRERKKESAEERRRAEERERVREDAIDTQTYTHAYSRIRTRTHS